VTTAYRIDKTANYFGGLSKVREYMVVRIEDGRNLGAFTTLRAAKAEVEMNVSVDRKIAARRAG
jgi:hypothetical protein